VLGDSSVKIKDIVVEGFASSFGKALLPSQLQTTLQTLKQTKRPLDPKERTEIEPEEVELAKASQEKYGDNPESILPGVLGWLTPQQQKALVDYKADIAKQLDVERRRKEQAQAKQTRGKRQPQAAPASTIASNFASKIKPAVTTAPPPQVQLPSGQYVTKYGNSWYDETGARITIPGDVDRLERMARGPSGQSQMATTKNTPVTFPGFRGKRR
jgi:hypothetical protein